MVAWPAGIGGREGGGYGEGFEGGGGEANFVGAGAACAQPEAKVPQREHERDARGVEEHGRHGHGELQ